MRSAFPRRNVHGASNRRRARLMWIGAWAAAVGLSCGGDASTAAPESCQSTYRLRVLVVPHYSVSSGLEPGQRPDQVRDGWKITYQRFRVYARYFTVTDLDRTQAGRHTADAPFWFDLMHAPHAGYVVADPFPIGGSSMGRWGFEYDVNAIAVAGTAERGAERVTFKWIVSAPIRCSGCADKGKPAGFCAADRFGAEEVKPTIHGERWFETSLIPRGEAPELRAEWLASCDNNHNGDLTVRELKACDASTALSQIPAGPYDLTGLVDQDGDGRVSVFDYVVTQAQRVGGVNHTGDCPLLARP